MDLQKPFKQGTANVSFYQDIQKITLFSQSHFGGEVC